MSEVTPAEWRKRCFVCGLAFLGVPALLSPLPLQAEKVAAEQYAAMVKPKGTADAAEEKAAESVKEGQFIRVMKQGSDRLKLRGQMVSREQHRALLGLVKASFPSADVSDRIKFIDGAKPDIKLGGISFALKALSHLQEGAARIDDEGVQLSGSCESRAAYAEVKHHIDNARPTGLVVVDDIALPPTHFSWRAEVGDGKIKITGAVPDNSDKKQIEGIVRTLFSGAEIVNDTYVSEGAPESWLDAAMHSLKVLRLLNSGVVLLNDQSVQVGGQVTDVVTLRKLDNLTDGYPAGYALESNVSVPSAAASMLSFGFSFSSTATAYGTGGAPVEETKDSTDLMTGLGEAR